MLEFKSKDVKNRVLVCLGKIRIADIDKQLDGIWSFSWFNNHELLRSDELRQIADKLDELNGKVK